MTPLRSLARSVIPRKYLPQIRRVYFTLRAPLYRGDRVHCPCCGGSFRKFLPGLFDRRPNAICPACGAWERHRLLWLFMQDRTNLFCDSLRLLHVAPEDIFQRLLAPLPNIDYLSGDLDSALAMVQLDVTDINFADGSFDVILCSHVLEHVPDDHRAMRELHRVLKPGGWAILQVPIKRQATFEDPTILSPEEREEVFGQRDHVRIYGRDYEDRLRHAGFKVRVVNPLSAFGAGAVQKYGLMDDEDIYWCLKSRVEPQLSQTG